MHAQAKTFYRSLRSPNPSTKQPHALQQEAEKPVVLRQFGNQVGGRASIFCYNSTTLCKPFVSRELYFYDQLPSALSRFTPEFKGVINVTFVESGDDDGSMIAFAHPATFIRKNSQAIRPLIEIPRPHSKRCVRDYGETHVIYPSNPLVSSIRSKPKIYAEFSAFDENDVERLAQGFGTNVSIRAGADEAEVGGGGDTCASELLNPWNSKVISDVWSKMKNGPGDDGMSKTTKRFMLLENVTSPYRRPCILDLKIGTRVRENASPAKLARHVTAIDVGARLSGMQIYNPDRKEFFYANKYYGHNLSVAGLKSNLVDFFSRGRSSTARLPELGDPCIHDLPKIADDNPKISDEPDLEHERFTRLVDAELVIGALNQLVDLREAIATVTSYRFYSGSVLLIYEGERNLAGQAAPSLDHQTQSTQAPSHSPPKNSNDTRHQTHPAPPTSETCPPGKFAKWRRTSGHRSRSCPQSASNSDATARQNAADTPVAGEPCPDIRIAEAGHPASSQARASQIPSQSSPEIADEASAPSKRSAAVARRPKTAPCVSVKNGAAPRRRDQGRLTSQRSVDCQERDVRAIDVRLIDFAHYCLNDPVVHPGPDGAFLFGIDSVISLLRSLITTSRRKTEANNNNNNR